MYWLGFFLVFVLFPYNVVTAKEVPYVLPEPDYNPTVPSPPCLDGEIAFVSTNSITVREQVTSGSGRETQVAITSGSVIFTVYGGYVARSELKVGQKTRVWYKGQSCSSPQLPLEAIRIQIASTAPSDDWP
jgi:hypothetical protein